MRSLTEIANENGLDLKEVMYDLMNLWTRREADVYLLVYDGEELIATRPITEGFRDENGQPDPEGYGYDLAIEYRKAQR